MATAEIKLNKMAFYNGGWSGWGASSGYVGSNSSSKFAYAYQVTVPSVLGNIQSLSFNAVTLSEGFSYYQTINCFVSITKTDPRTLGNLYAGGNVESDSGRVGSSEPDTYSVGGAISTTILDGVPYLTAGTYYIVISPGEDLGWTNIADDFSASITYDAVADAPSVINAVLPTELGTNVSFTISRVKSTYRHTITYNPGPVYDSTSAVQLASGIETAFDWTPAIGLISYMSNDEKATFTLSCATYNGNAFIGRKDTLVVLVAPSNAVPYISRVSVSRPNMGTEVDDVIDEIWHAPPDFFLQGYSRAYIEVIPDMTKDYYDGPYYGISSCVVSIAGENYHVDDLTSLVCTSSVIPVSGEVYVTVVLTDNRGRSSTYNTSIIVTPYSRPSVRAVNCYRSEKIDGEYIPSQAGKSISASASPTFSSCKGYNSIDTFKAGWKITTAPDADYIYTNLQEQVYIREGATEFSANWLSKTDGGAAIVPDEDSLYEIQTVGLYYKSYYRWNGTSYYPDSNVVILADEILSPTTSYIVQFVVSDQISTYTMTVIIPTQSVTYHARSGGTGFAIGTYADVNDATILGYNKLVLRGNAIYGDAEVDSLSGTEGQIYFKLLG